MGKFEKEDWGPRGATKKMTWTGDFAYHVDDERAVRSLIAQASGAHSVTVTTKAWPEDEIADGTWSYTARGAWHHDVARILQRHFRITTVRDETEPGTVYLAAQGERVPA